MYFRRVCIMNIVAFVLLVGLCIIELFVVWKFVEVGWPKRSNRSTALKCTGSFVFITTAVVATLLGGGFSTVACIMLLGFFMSLIGDFWLDLEMNDKNIFVGILCFFMAHLSYIVAFAMVCERDLGATSLFSKGELIAIAVVFIVAASGSFIFKMDMRKLFVPVAIYSLTICTMVVKAIYMCTQMLKEKQMALPMLMLLSLGTLLFIVSDVVLAFMYFHNNFTKKMRVVNLATYFSGQMLMAISLIEIAN